MYVGEISDTRSTLTFNGLFFYFIFVSHPNTRFLPSKALPGTLLLFQEITRATFAAAKNLAVNDDDRIFTAD